LHRRTKKPAGETITLFLPPENMAAKCKNGSTKPWKVFGAHSKSVHGLSLRVKIFHPLHYSVGMAQMQGEIGRFFGFF
jgi:hypothetical protein